MVQGSAAARVLRGGGRERRLKFIDNQRVTEGHNALSGNKHHHVEEREVGEGQGRGR